MVSLKRSIFVSGMLYSILALCFASSPCQLRLRDEGRVLSCHCDRGDFLVKRLSPKQEFQGFGLVDEHTVFFAHSDGDSEPGTALSVFDLDRKRQQRIGALGATSDTSFELNQTSGVVAFNWYDGIYVFSIRRAMALPKSANLFSAFEEILVKVATCQRCIEPHWVSPSKLRYVELAKHGKTEMREITIPALPAKNAIPTPASITSATATMQD